MTRDEYVAKLKSQIDNWNAEAAMQGADAAFKSMQAAFEKARSEFQKK